MIYAILITGILIVIGILFPFVSLPIWGLALCVLAWCLKDVIPYLGHYDSDSVERYFKTQEDAMIWRLSGRSPTRRISRRSGTRNTARR